MSGASLIANVGPGIRISTKDDVTTSSVPAVVNAGIVFTPERPYPAYGGGNHRFSFMLTASSHGGGNDGTTDGYTGVQVGPGWNFNNWVSADVALVVGGLKRGRYTDMMADPALKIGLLPTGGQFLEADSNRHLLNVQALVLQPQKDIPGFDNHEIQMTVDLELLPALEISLTIIGLAVYGVVGGIGLGIEGISNAFD